MAINTDRVTELTVKYLRDALSDAEREELDQWLADPFNRARFEERIKPEYILEGVAIMENAREELAAAGWPPERKREPASVVPLGVQIQNNKGRRKWIVAAAAIIAGIGVATWTMWDHSKPLGSAKAEVAQDIPPGGNKATLVLADGSKVELDSVSMGQVAAQGGVRIVKQSNGLIAYEVARMAAKVDLGFNTLHTPNAGQYALRLPDGTHVYVNNATELRYPVAFTGASRDVFLSGEAYFEVEHSDSKPFIVHLENQENIEVLGTRFDIVAYRDEPNAVRTVLMDGKVKVNFKANSVVLKPGQQAVNNGGSLVVDSANIRDAIAWKNGFFCFNDASAAEILKQLSRWYDVPVRLNDESARQRRFDGRMSRDLTLRQALKILQDQQLPYAYDEVSGAIVEKKKL